MFLDWSCIRKGRNPLGVVQAIGDLLSWRRTQRAHDVRGVAVFGLHLLLVYADYFGLEKE